MRGWIENLRKWIDGEEDLDEQGEPRPRSKWDDFLVAVAREIEASMQREMFTPPGGPTYVPREYIVFMSTADDGSGRARNAKASNGVFITCSPNARKSLAATTIFRHER